jgi:hypothetical protein
MSDQTRNEHIVLARLVALERRVKHLEDFIVGLSVSGSLLPGTHSAFMKRLRELDQQDAAEDPRR